MDFSAGALFASMLVSTAGFGIFIYGKKQMRVPQLIGGVTLMIAPYMIGGVPGILGVGAGVGLLLWLAVRAGL